MQIFDLLGNQHAGNGTMRIKLKAGSPGSGIRGENGEHLEQGEEHAVSDYFGQLLVAAGRALRIGEAIADVVDQVVNRDPQPDHRDPQPTPAGRRPRRPRVQK